jgi:putative FmdB family regulatory protein
LTTRDSDWLAFAAPGRFASLEFFPAPGILSHMPIYEFHCEKCGRDSEILVRSSNWDGTKCPHCGSSELDKKFSTFAAAGSGGDSPAGNSGGGGGGGCCGGHCGGH